MDQKQKFKGLTDTMVIVWILTHSCHVSDTFCHFLLENLTETNKIPQLTQLEDLGAQLTQKKITNLINIRVVI